MIPQVAILGARGIGQVHARIFQKSGANVCAILGSSMQTAQNTAKLLHQTLGISPKPFDNLETLIKETQLDALSICTPVECHFKQILTAFDQGLPVFCEKPLFWEKNLSLETLEAQISLISKYEGRHLLLNTSNAYFMELVLREMRRPSTIKSFSFKFYTQGPHRGKDIALDLLPHGFSLLTNLLGYKKIIGVMQKVKPNSYQCQFSYEDCQVSFDFREKKDGLKHLAFSINDREFTREQEGQGETYRVYLKDHLTGMKLEAEDPFQVYISRFLSGLNSGNTSTLDRLDDGIANLHMMFQVYFGETYGPH
jgi:predicted dehydrogenase